MFVSNLVGADRGPVLSEKRPSDALAQIEALAAKLVVPSAALFVQHFLERLYQCRHRVAELAARVEDADRRMNMAVIRLLTLDPERPEISSGNSSGSQPEERA